MFIVGNVLVQVQSTPLLKIKRIPSKVIAYIISIEVHFG